MPAARPDTPGEAQAQRTPSLAPESFARSYPRFLPVGDTALTVEFSDAVDPQANDAVAGLDLALTAEELPGLVEVVPTYRSLTIHYEPAVLPGDVLIRRLRALAACAPPPNRGTARRWTVPVAYDAPFGMDVAEVASLLALNPEDVIALHSRAEYRVYMVGFLPGLPCLGGLPDRLHIPRRTVPRPRIPCGSVAIGGSQAAVMSADTPSGWYVLGHTPVLPFHKNRPETMLFRQGDSIRFRRIDPADMERLQAAAAAGDPVATFE